MSAVEGADMVESEEEDAEAAEDDGFGGVGRGSGCRRDCR